MPIEGEDGAREAAAPAGELQTTSGEEECRTEVRDEVMQMEGELEFGSDTCYCPKCEKEYAHTKRGIPCSETMCPKCGSAMIGRKCREES